MKKEKILEIFKKHSVYRDSEAFIKDVEMFGEDEDGNDISFDEKFIVEDVDSYMDGEIQYVKLDFVEEIIKEAVLNFHKDIFGKEIIRDRFNEAQLISPKEIYDKIEKHFGDFEDDI